MQGFINKDKNKGDSPMNNNQKTIERNTIIVSIVMIVIIIVGSFMLKHLQSPANNTNNNASENSQSKLVDGTYTADSAEPHNGFTGNVTMEVSDGKITSLIYDSVGEDGQNKSVLAANGEYVMTKANKSIKYLNIII